MVGYSEAFVAFDVAKKTAATSAESDAPSVTLPSIHVYLPRRRSWTPQGARHPPGILFAAARLASVAAAIRATKHSKSLESF